MEEPWWVLTLKVFGGPLVSGLVAAGITYWFSRRRFIGERWWERKADVYARTISDLVALVRIFLGKEEFESWQVSLNKYQELVADLHSVAVEGSYVISGVAEDILWDLWLRLDRNVDVDSWKRILCEEEVEPPLWPADYYARKTGIALDSIRKVARLDLGVGEGDLLTRVRLRRYRRYWNKHHALRITWVS